METNVQDFQRLSDAINMTVEACRRLVPQLGHLQQVCAHQLFGSQVGAGNVFGGLPVGGVGYGQGSLPPGVDPITLAMLQSRGLGYGQPWVSPWTTGTSQFAGLGISPFATQVPFGIGQQPYGAQPFNFGVPFGANQAPIAAYPRI